MSKYTKGPWKLGTKTPIGIVNGGEVFVTLFAGDETQYIGPSRLGDLVDNEDLPNARLIAAAPELLEALKSILERSIFNREDSPTIVAIKRAEQAIAKAEGKNE